MGVLSRVGPEHRRKRSAPGAGGSEHPPAPGADTGSDGGLAHVAGLVLLAATARAGVVAADLLAAVADRLDLLVRLAAVGPRLLFRHRPRRRLVHRRAGHPH